MEFAPDNKLFVLEQTGAIEVYEKNAANVYTQVAPNNNFLSRVSNGANHITVNSSGERGLLGIAFDPNYATNRYVYIYYTTSTAPIHNRIARFTANAAGTQVVENSQANLVELDNLSSATNHNGGAMHFGLDGKLYVAVGENANSANSQSLSNRLGKILRYNPDGTIPADNPTSISGIAGTTTGANRAIWAAGLRNPYTFAFHPVTGRMHINDVGQNTWEEINIGIVGANYGWGTLGGANEGPFSQVSFPNYTPPAVYYHHTDGSMSFGGNYTGGAITGGEFYRTSQSYQFPSDYLDDYFFPDLLGGWVRRWDYTTNSVMLFANPLASDAIVDMKVSPDGELFYLARDFYGSTVTFLYRVQYSGPTAPYIVEQPNNTTVIEGNSATFRVVPGGPGLTYQWQKDNVDIPGANGLSYTFNSAQLIDNNSTFRVVVHNSFGDVTSASATLTVQPPYAKVSEFRVDDGTGQRSMVRSLQLTIDTIVSPTGTLSSAFSFVGPSGSVGFSAGPIDNSSGHSVIPIAFSDPSLEFGSLPQGDFTFTVDASQFVDTLGRALDGDGNGTAGGNYVGTFHRLLGDANGDRRIDGTDFTVLRTCFGTSTGQPEFLSYMDFNNDGVINSTDFAEFRKKFGLMI